MSAQRPFTIDFIGIGAQKAGTTWLAECLMEHPQIYVPKKKELDYWNRIKHCPATRQRQYSGFDEYKQQFAGAKPGQLLGEFSTHYIYDPESAKLIHEYSPSVKIIAILRDPVYRALSQYAHTRKLIPVPDTFEEASKKFPEFIERGFYYEQLKRYYDLFPAEQIKVVLFEDLKEDPERVIGGVYSFLGVDSSFPPEALHRKVNAKQAVKRETARNAKNMIKRSAAGLWLVRKLSHTTAKQLLERLYLAPDTSHYEVASSTRNELVSRFTADKRQLEHLLGRTIDSWSF
ncbi:MAG: sulfotransferase domain-containing protein [Candidatus Kerfeldbacteria bacterium]